jgi:hypothetical protein
LPLRPSRQGAPRPQLTIENVSAIIAVISAIIGFGIWLRTRHSRRANVIALEDYLRARRDGYDMRRCDSYQHTIDHLVARLRLSREEIFDAAKRSKYINIIPRADAKGMAEGHLFEYRKS